MLHITNPQRFFDRQITDDTMMWYVGRNRLKLLCGSIDVSNFYPTFTILNPEREIRC